ncbi:MAG TPA: HEAT repeat domain-containing protein [Allosphingosinicella sp.]|nr:HEAT repeat domain-containing protein [Allosphingosinicella sp.]
MIVSDALKAWIGNRDAQRETQASVDAFGHDWGLGPIHRRFDDAMASLPASASAEQVADVVRLLFADHGWVDVLVSSLARKMRADPYFDPPFRNLNSDAHAGLLVFEDAKVSIAAGVTGALQLAAKKDRPRGAASVNFSGQLNVLNFVRAGGATLSFWEAPRLGPDFTAADAGTCRRAGARRIDDGEILLLDGRHQSYVIEGLRGSLVLLQATIAVDQAPLSVEYDSETGAYLGCSATGDTSSRIQMISTLLRKLDHQAAFPAIAAFLDHPDFFVRWHVMKELLGLDAEAALPHLNRMAATDPHPEPRRAARLVLDRIEAPAPAAARKAA